MRRGQSPSLHSRGELADVVWEEGNGNRDVSDHFVEAGERPEVDGAELAVVWEVVSASVALKLGVNPTLELLAF